MEKGFFSQKTRRRLSPLREMSNGSLKKEGEEEGIALTWRSEAKGDVMGFLEEKKEGGESSAPSRYLGS